MREEGEVMVRRRREGEVRVRMMEEGEVRVRVRRRERVRNKVRGRKGENGTRRNVCVRDGKRTTGQGDGDTEGERNRGNVKKMKKESRS